MSGKVTIDRSSPDPRAALATFTWNMAAAREAGLTPPAEYSLIEALFRGTVGVAFFSSIGGTCSIILDRDSMAAYDDDDFHHVIAKLAEIKRRNRRRSAHRTMTADDIGLLTDTKALGTPPHE